MHTIAHVDKDLRTPYFSDIQKQIFDRFYRLIHRDADGALYLGERDDDPQRVNLVAFETKPKKARDSIILKLLHKPENVAEDIFDRVGIRLITETPLGALRVIKVLKDRMVVMPPNIKPSRSRNTLVDLDDFRAQLGDLLARAERDEFDEQQLLRQLEPAAHVPAVNPENPHSSEFYRAIQFTCRQLIKLRNPLYEEIKEIKGQAKGKSIPEELARAIDRVDFKNVQREIRFFYPFEVQVVDVKSNEENEKGRSAHSEYKKAQLQTALKRVMGSLADAVR
ncbi:MAG: TIGR04552 family protein [Bdellovibrionota bacterium]